MIAYIGKINKTFQIEKKSSMVTLEKMPIPHYLYMVIDAITNSTDGMTSYLSLILSSSYLILILAKSTQGHPLLTLYIEIDLIEE